MILRSYGSGQIIAKHSLVPVLLEWEPWLIGALKYLEIKIEEWQSRAKWGQSVPNGAKWCQMTPNRVKRGQTRPKRVLQGQTWPKGPNGPNEAKWGQMGLIFCMHTYFYEIKKSCLATQALRQKLAKLWQYCHFLVNYRHSLKALSLFLYLSEEIFFLYHLKAFLNGFIFSRYSKFLGAPFEVKNWF